MTNLDELRKKAEAATPGPWRVGTPPPNGEHTIGNMKGLMVAVATVGAGLCSLDNAKYIAAANPAVVLELIAEIERWKKEAARLQKLNQGLIDILPKHLQEQAEQ